MKHYWLTITYLEDEDEDDDKILINATATSTQQFMKTTSVFRLWRVKNLPSSLASQLYNITPGIFAEGFNCFFFVQKL